MSDFELLKQYQSGSADAFAELVRRHVNWIYSAARRRVGDAHLAEDVTQAVFIALAQRPPRASKGGSLSPWLFGSMMLTCKTALRAQSTRRRHETEAAKMRKSAADAIDNAQWEAIAPNLEEAVSQLRFSDRQAVLLRFYEQKSFAEVGELLDITEEAARKRVSRAMEKLRHRLTSSESISSMALVPLLASHLITAAPPTLASAIATSSLAASSATAATVLAKEVAAMISWFKIKLAAALVMCFALSGAGVLLLAQLAPSGPVRTVAPIAAAVSQPSTAPSVPTNSVVAVRVRITDQAGKVLPEGIVKTESDTGEQRYPVNAAGEAIVQYTPTRHGWLRIHAIASGHVPVWAQWGWPIKADQKSPPESITFPLTNGIVLGGKLINEMGEPIAGAEVTISTNAAVEGNPNFSAGDIVTAYFGDTVTTDAQGHWKTDMAPPTWGRAYVEARHPDYFSPNSSREQTDVGALKAGTAVSTMVLGRAISGRVLDAQQKPIAGATVLCDRSISGNSATRTTDGDGRFLFAHADPLQTHVVVRAENFGAASKIINDSDPGIVDFQLSPARHVHGRVVDDAGKPVDDAWVWIMGWERMDQISLPGWQLYSDDQGLFSVDLPSDSTMYALAAKEGYSSLRWIPLRPGDNEPTFALRSPAHVTGQVSDGNTGKPITSFRVLGSTDDPQMSSSWTQANNEKDSRGTNGDYEFVFYGVFNTHRVRIEADGYLPISSDLLIPTDGKYTFNAKLVPAANITGTVLGPDLSPVSNAKVMMLIRDGGRITTLNEKMDLLRSNVYRQVFTTADGTFSLPPPGEGFDLFVVHENGYIRMSSVTFETSPNGFIVLEPWGKIEGNVAEAAQTAVPIAVNMRSPLMPRSPNSFVQFDYKAIADPKTGHYVLQHVPAGPIDLVLEIADQTRSWTPVKKSIEIATGQTAVVNFDEAVIARPAK